MTICIHLICFIGILPLSMSQRISVVQFNFRFSHHSLNRSFGSQTNERSKKKHPNKVYCQQNISKKTFEKILWKEQIKFRKKYWISIESNQELKQTTEKRRWKVVKMSTMSATFQAKFIGLVFCFHFFLSICIVDKI